VLLRDWSASIGAWLAERGESGITPPSGFGGIGYAENAILTAFSSAFLEAT